MFNLSAKNTHQTSHIAAIDLGSNSFHMIVARWDNGQIVEENLFYDLVTFMKQIGLGG